MVFNLIKSPHIGFRMINLIHVCIVVHRNSPPTIVNTYEKNKRSSDRNSHLHLFQHCRNCGFIVCEGCSKKRFLLSHLDSKPVRICDSCFTKLSAATSPKGKYQFDHSIEKLQFSSAEARAQIRDSSDSDGEETNAQYSHTPVSEDLNNQF